MKTRTYYRCKNCDKITAKESGERLVSCLDCGSNSLQVLVPVSDDVKADPLSGGKKSALLVFIGLAGISSIAVFLIFGRLLQGYLVFDATREANERAQQRLAAEIQTQEAAITSLSKKAAEEVTQASERTRQLESAANSAKAALLEAENALHRAQLTFSNETSRVSGVQTEMAELEGERAKLRKKVDALGAEDAAISAAIAAAASRTNRLASEVAAAMLAQTSASADLAKVLTALDRANADRDKAKDQWETQLARVAALGARRQALEVEISDREKTQAILDASIAELKKQSAAALAETTRARAGLDTINTARDKAREEADAQSARSSILKAQLSALEKAKAEVDNGKGALGK